MKETPKMPSMSSIKKSLVARKLRLNGAKKAANSIQKVVMHLPDLPEEGIYSPNLNYTL
jgi:hypothetical protein